MDEQIQITANDFLLLMCHERLQIMKCTFHFTLQRDDDENDKELRGESLQVCDRLIAYRRENQRIVWNAYLHFVT